MTLIKSISGIRGTIGGKAGDTLSPLDTVKFAAAYGEWLIRTNRRRKVVLGRDARVSGAIISDLVIATLLAMGIDVVNLGLSTTPTVEMAVTMEEAGGGIILTASHNPAHWNALKLLNEKGEFVSAQDSLQIIQIADTEDYTFAQNRDLGQSINDDTYIDKHIEKILALPLVNKEAIKAKKFRIAIDCVNSTGGIALPKLLAALGVEQVEKLYCEPDGKFAHNPEPLPENITAISAKMETGNFHLGIVVDPDVDRLAFLCEDGTPFGEEYTLVAVADYVLKHTPGNTVSNICSTRALTDITNKYGNQHFQSAVGEVNVIEMMKAQNAVIGGEGNGGVIYPELHYGRDALVGIALFLSHLATFEGTVKLMKMKYPSYHISKNKIELTNDIDVDSVIEQVSKKYITQPQNKLDGLKIEYNKEWVHLRRSNTEPIIRIYSESDTLSTADYLAQKIISDIKEIIHEKILM